MARLKAAPFQNKIERVAGVNRCAIQDPRQRHIKEVWRLLGERGGMNGNRRQVRDFEGKICAQWFNRLHYVARGGRCSMGKPGDGSGCRLE